MSNLKKITLLDQPLNQKLVHLLICPRIFMISSGCCEAKAISITYCSEVSDVTMFQVSVGAQFCNNHKATIKRLDVDLSIIEGLEDEKMVVEDLTIQEMVPNRLLPLHNFPNLKRLSLRFFESPKQFNVNDLANCPLLRDVTIECI